MKVCQSFRQRCQKLRPNAPNCILNWRKKIRTPPTEALERKKNGSNGKVENE